MEIELEKNKNYHFKDGVLYSQENKRYYIYCKFLEYHTLNDRRFIKVSARRRRSEKWDEFWIAPDMIFDPNKPLNDAGNNG